MWACFVFIAVAMSSAGGAFVAPPRLFRRGLCCRQPAVAMSETDEQADSVQEAAVTTADPEPPPRAFDLKAQMGAQSKQGAGFNQFDPVLSATSFISRRFGLVGGLALVALLAATEGNEIVKGFSDKGPQPGSGATVTTASGLSWTEQLVGTSGSAITSSSVGSVIGLKVKVSIGEKILFDTELDKPVAFRYGKRPFENVLCDGVEQGIVGMKVGGRRTLTVPATLAPRGLELPSGVPLTYAVEVTEVLPGYF
jgi:hypothetical protein